MNFGPVVGIDVSKRFSDMCILSPDNQIFAQTKIYHDSTSMKRAEATSHYHLILFQFFSDCGYNVLVVNPLQSNSMKDFSIRKRKTDKVDALKLAMLYRTKTLRPSQIPQSAIRVLRLLCWHE